MDMSSTRRRPPTPGHALKAAAVAYVLAAEHDRFVETRHVRHAARAYQLARRMGVSIPDWVLRQFDALAVTLTRETPRTKTADRYAAALACMHTAVDCHHRRLRIRAVAKQHQVSIPPISRRDRPNLTAIARQAAREYGVSVNRLLERYRRSR